MLNKVPFMLRSNCLFVKDKGGENDLQDYVEKEGLYFSFGRIEISLYSLMGYSSYRYTTHHVQNLRFSTADRQEDRRRPTFSQRCAFRSIKIEQGLYSLACFFASY